MNLETESQQVVEEASAIYHQGKTKEELAATLVSMADDLESYQAKSLEIITKANPIIEFIESKMDEAEAEHKEDVEQMALIAEARDAFVGWKYAFQRAQDFFSGTGWPSRPPQSIQEFALVLLDEEPAKAEADLAKHLKGAKDTSKTIYAAIALQNKIRAAKAKAGIPEGETLPGQELNNLLWEVLESKPASTIRLAEGDEEPHPIEDGTWVEQEAFILRHLADYLHTEVVFSPKALEEGVEIRIGNRTYRLRVRLP